MIGLIALALAGQAAAANPAPAEIVVRARRGKCRIEYANQTISNHRIDELAKGWALGTPVRVIEPPGADRKCITKLTFQLADRGVRLVEFVHRHDDR